MIHRFLFISAAALALLMMFRYHPAAAAVALEQLDNSQTWASNTYLPGPLKFGQAPLSLSGSALYVGLAGEDAGCAFFPNFHLVQFDSESDFNANTNGSGVDATVAIFDQNGDPMPGILIGDGNFTLRRFALQFETSTNVVSGKWYSINGDCGDTSRRIGLLGNGPNTTTSTRPWFILSDDLQEALGNIEPNTIEFRRPSDGTTIADFSDWQVLINRNATTSLTRTIFIDYSQSTSTIGSDRSDQLDVPGDVTGQTPYAIPKSSALILPAASSTQTWYATASLTEGTTTIASTTISFDIIFDLAVGQTTCGLPESSFALCISTTEDSSTLNSFNLGQAIKGALCKTLVCLFTPTQSSVQGLTTAMEPIKNKPPFGWFGSLSTAIGNLQNTTTSLALMTPSTTAALSPFLGPIDAAIAIVLYLMAGFYIYHQMRHIQL